MGLTVKQANSLGYFPARVLPNGETVGIVRMNFTFGLFVGIDRLGNRGRYCYPTRQDAIEAMEKWDGTGDPPGPWIKRKVAGMPEATGPGYKL